MRLNYLSKLQHVYIISLVIFYKRSLTSVLPVPSVIHSVPNVIQNGAEAYINRASAAKQKLDSNTRPVAMITNNSSEQVLAQKLQRK